MNKRIVIGIPSYNDEDTIGNLVEQVDLGLKRFYPTLSCLIINVDSDSKDNTREIFLRTSRLLTHAAFGVDLQQPIGGEFEAKTHI